MSKCPPGQYTDSLNLATTCQQCPRNSTAPAEGLTGCGNCIIGIFSNDGINCNVCDAGTVTSVGISSTECKNCLKGKYQDDGTEDKCKNCPSGYHQNKAKSSICLPCIPGKYQDISGQSSCKQCPKNTKSEKANSTKCDSCEGGKKSEAGSAKHVKNVI